ncbi:hypothetical protein GTO91_12930 [Heliobacterium undosum]|uniref:Uncharacterized protein n=1 Tax=Heliomicrobium undosum TaxID=121734 RepID=A0A845LAA0_9FIRM|nr:hypothetical protein [Heliomicrobium undosum]MZP30618.1 hypothetical protein [Heliomicrobium undosum]
MDKEKLITIAEELSCVDWSFEGGRDRQVVTATVVREVSNVFRDLSRDPMATDPLRVAVQTVEKLSASPFARGGSMKGQYRKVMSVLRINNGRIDHPKLKGLSFAQLAFTLSWLNRIYREDELFAAKSFKPADTTSKKGDTIDPRWAALSKLKL